MRATRRTQPHRRGQREPSLPLSAMLKGSPMGLPNPMDAQRNQAHLLSLLLRRMRG